MSEQSGGQEPQLTEEQLRQLEAEIDRITVDDVVLQTIVSLINLGARKGAVGAPPEAGLQPDLEQLRQAIDAAKALMAVVEPRHGEQIAPLRDAIAQLQMHYARGAGAGGPGAGAAGAVPQDRPPEGAGEQGAPQGGQGGPGEAQRSGRLWVPGQ